MDDELLQEIKATLADARTGHAVPDRALYVKHVGELMKAWDATLVLVLASEDKIAQLEAENKELRRELVAAETEE